MKKKSAPGAAPTVDARIIVQRLPLAKLKRAPYNPRKALKPGDPAFERLQRGISEFGYVDPIIWNRRTGNVVGGHQRLSVLEAKGAKTADVSVVDLDPQREAALNILLNNPAAQGEYDMAQLSELLSRLDAEGLDVTLSGFDGPELQAVLNWRPEGGLREEDPDVDLTPPAKPKSEVGGVYVLGRHRVMCGDARESEQLASLLNGATPRIVYADPPYGVDIVGKAGTVSSGLPPGPALRGKVGGDKPFGLSPRRGKVFDDSAMRVKGLIRSNVYDAIIGDSSTDTAKRIYVACAALEAPVMIFWGGNYYAEALPPSSCWIVWDKDVWDKDNGDSFFADAELAWTNQKTAVRIFKHTWNGLIKASERGEGRVHPTQKPVALAEWCFVKYGEPGDSVLDPTGGSGSALIAAEKRGNTAFLMEMAPAYVDVIRRRYAEFVNDPSLAP